MRLPLLFLLIGLIFCPAAVHAQEPNPLKVGIIGLDTSHVTAFTGLLNNPKAKPELAGVRVVAAFPAGSPDVESSAPLASRGSRTR